jgi:hypothetical protein
MKLVCWYRDETRSGPFKTHLHTDHELPYRDEIRNQSTPKATYYIRVKVTLVARAMLLLVAQELCR